MEKSDQFVRVLYNFEYSKDGRNVWMKEGEALNLLKKTNPDWWQVIRTNERRPFYVPAAYVEELSLEKIEKRQELGKNVVKNDTKKDVIPGKGKLCDKNLFKEFPVSDLKEDEKCNSERSEKCSDKNRNSICEKEGQDLTLEKEEQEEEDEEEAKRLLLDKRKSWAAEELVSELTQMAIARNEPSESDYVNLRVDGERFVIAPNEEDEVRVSSSLFWQSSNFAKDARNNPMSSSDELDNSDSLGDLGRSNCIAWQSKYSLSSEGDKTDESIQSFHSLGNESVNSRHWRDEQLEVLEDRGSAGSARSADSSPYGPYAHVICTGSTSSISIETTHHSGLRMSESLERLAQQIKFPGFEDDEDDVDDVDEDVPPIAPPREYEAPVYENVDVQAKTADPDPSLEQDDEDMPRPQTICAAEPGEEQTVISDDVGDAAETDDGGDLESRDEDCDIDDTVDEEEADEADAPPKPAERTKVLSAVHAVESGEKDKERAPLDLEGIVDVKQKIALWNNTGVESERLDKFDGEANPRPRKARPFRTLGVVKSASESRVSALVSRHGRQGLPQHGPATSDSRSGSEEFLDASSPGSEAGLTRQLNPEGDNLDASDSGLSNKSDDVLGVGARRRRASLMRSRRVESCRRFQRVAPGLGGATPAAPSVPRPQSPPPPSPGQEAARLMPAGWAEFRTADGRSFYYHAASGQRRWKPPRRRPRQDSGRSASSSPLQGEEADGEDQDCDAEPAEAAPGPLPQGWKAVMDQSGQLCYVNPQHGNKWFSSSDNKGRVYFFEENSCESSWNLPDVNSSVTQELTLGDDNSQPPALSPTPNENGGERPVKLERSEKLEKISLRTTKSRSMVIVDSVAKDVKSTATKNWPQLFDGDMCVLKEGPMYRTKITENGKKLRKNWSSSHVVLTELFLLLFRDSKSFAAMKSAAPSSTAPRPELTVDLNGALIDQIDRGDKASVTSRKNVFLVSTVYGLQVLFQCDSSQQAEEWYNSVHSAIHNLPSGFDSCPRIKVTKEMDRLFGESNSPEITKKFPRIGRSKSVKIKNGSIEDLVSVAEQQTKIKDRLRKFFNRRPTKESLVKKGIYRDEPAFGCTLEEVTGNESPRVPLFVQRCIAVIESSEDNMKTDGLYRASGNLSQVQKIRIQVDQSNLSVLDLEEDVHVLTGALKLFFRELKGPLIPYTAFSKAIKASTLQNKKEKLYQFREIVKSLPSANHDTLKFLLKHLLKVTNYQEFNRMHIPNLAIVFGPTLMWSEQESLNMALDLMQQNLVIEAFLQDFDSIFR